MDNDQMLVKIKVSKGWIAKEWLYTKELFDRIEDPGDMLTRRVDSLAGDVLAAIEAKKEKRDE